MLERSQGLALDCAGRKGVSCVPKKDSVFVSGYCKANVVYHSSAQNRLAPAAVTAVVAAGQCPLAHCMSLCEFLEHSHLDEQPLNGLVLPCAGTGDVCETCLFLAATAATNQQSMPPISPIHRLTIDDRPHVLNSGTTAMSTVSAWT